jgi:putative membrane protein insertion efficiency factor
MIARKMLLVVIVAYQKILSPDTGMFALRRGTTCVFYPTCSEYAKQAVSKYGIFKGLFLGIRRIFRCHPWQKNHDDPMV